ncbi:MAG: hypothetical protein GXP08_16415 [Gammaproteobacteria bacterium]|nr:hypothetical protein [Gammaproteobacteria bacterium]
MKHNISVSIPRQSRGILTGISHILVWIPLTYILIKRDLKNTSFKPTSPYGIWIMLLLGTIAISLIFDVRDITLVMLGMK